MQKYNFSKHSIDRFKERFPKLIENNNPIKTIANLLYSAQEDRRCINNTNFMTYIYETYGYDNPMTLYVNDNVLFLCREDTLVTVFPVSESILGDNSSSFKSSKR